MDRDRAHCSRCGGAMKLIRIEPAWWRLSGASSSAASAGSPRATPGRCERLASHARPSLKAPARSILKKDLDEGPCGPSRAGTKARATPEPRGAQIAQKRIFRSSHRKRDHATPYARIQIRKLTRDALRGGYSWPRAMFFLMSQQKQRTFA